MMYTYSEERAKFHGVATDYENWAKSVEVDLSKPAKFVSFAGVKYMYLDFNPHIGLKIAVNRDIFTPFVVDKKLEDYL